MYSDFSIDLNIKISDLVHGVLLGIFGQNLICLVGNDFIKLYKEFYKEILSVSAIFWSCFNYSKGNMLKIPFLVYSVLVEIFGWYLNPLLDLDTTEGNSGVPL